MRFNQIKYAIYNSFTKTVIVLKDFSLYHWWGEIYWFPAGAIVCVDPTSSPHVFVGFLHRLPCRATFQRCASEGNRPASITPVWVSGGGGHEWPLGPCFRGGFCLQAWAARMGFGCPGLLTGVRHLEKINPLTCFY